MIRHIYIITLPLASDNIGVVAAMCLRHYCYPARSSRAQPSVRSGLRIIDDSIPLTSKTAWRVLVVYIHTRRAEPLLNKTASLRKSKMPATCLDRSGRTDGLGRAEPFCLDRLRALRSERGSGSDLWTLWHMSSGVFRDEHHQSITTSGRARAHTDSFSLQIHWRGIRST